MRRVLLWLTARYCLGVFTEMYDRGWRRGWEEAWKAAWKAAWEAAWEETSPGGTD